MMWTGANKCGPGTPEAKIDMPTYTRYTIAPSTMQTVNVRLAQSRPNDSNLIITINYITYINNE